MSDVCGYCLGIRLVGWSGAGPILCPSCSDGQDAFTVIITQAWREQRTLAVALAHENDILRSAISDLAEGDCVYGDGCPTFGSNHGKCYSCKARQALSEAKQ